MSVTQKERKSVFEKIINIGMKVYGIFYAIDAIVIYLGHLVPTAFSNGTVRLAIAFILLFCTYSSANKNNNPKF